MVAAKTQYQWWRKRQVSREVKNVRKTWAKRFRQFREENGLTQRDLCFAMEISRRELQYIEAAKVSIQSGIIQKFEALAKKYNQERLKEAKGVKIGN